MEEIKVSVIIPVFNAEKYLRQCLNSVVNQTLQEIEIICVDDGSTDASADVIREIAGNDPRIRMIHQENKGAGSARNQGMVYACGRYLSFLDADDFFEPDMLRTAYEKAEFEKDDIVVWRSDRYFNEQDSFRPDSNTINRWLLPEREPFAGIDIEKDIFHAFVGWPWDKLFRTDFVKEKNLQFQEQRTTNDLLFVYSAIAAANRISTVETVFAHHRVLESGRSLSKSRELSWSCFYYALLALRDQLKRWRLFERFEQDFINYSLHFSIWNLETISGSAFFDLYDKLKSEWFNELTIWDKPETYFYWVWNYKYLCFIRDHSAVDFLFYHMKNLENNCDMFLTSLDNSNRSLTDAREELNRKDQELSEARTELDKTRQELLKTCAELDMLHRSLSEIDGELDQTKQMLAQSGESLKNVTIQRNQILSSNAWKIGSMITLIPGTIKRWLHEK